MWTIIPHRDGSHLCHRSPFQADQPFDVVDEVGETDFGGRPGDADGPDEQPHPALLFGKDVLDVGAHLGLEIVGSPRRLTHRLALGLLAVDAADEAVVVRKPPVDVAHSYDRIQGL